MSETHLDSPVLDHSSPRASTITSAHSIVEAVVFQPNSPKGEVLNSPVTALLNSSKKVCVSSALPSIVQLPSNDLRSCTKGPKTAIFCDFSIGKVWLSFLSKTIDSQAISYAVLRCSLRSIVVC